MNLAHPTRSPTGAPTVAPTVLLVRAPSAPADGHDTLSKAQVAEWLAELLGGHFGGELDPQAPPDGPLYFVPTETLTAHDARRLGIRGPGDLYGGVVPEPFVASKLVAHALVEPDRRAPRGWQNAVHASIAAAVLPGCSAFTIADADEAGRRLLAGGAVRIKDPQGVGGVGQWVVRDADELIAQLQAIGAARIESHGLALERNLEGVTTLSVGTLRLGALEASYHGSQRLTRNHRGHEVYGGSTLHVVRGGLDALLLQPLEPELRTAVQQALAFHRALSSGYPAFYASRCNYDIAQGRDASGAWCSGVLEQSWRIGGASGAEALALQALQRDDGLGAVQASTHEIYGEATLPAGARRLYDGVDARAGRLVKYACIDNGDHRDGQR